MKNNGLKYIVIAALLLNVTTLIFFWLKFASPDDGRKPPPRDLLQQELQFNGKQLAAFELLKKHHHEKHGDLLRQISDKRKVLYAPNPVSIDSTVHQIGLLQEEIELMTFHHWEDVRKICTPEQQSKLDTMLFRSVQRILNPNSDRKPPPKRD